MPKQPQPKWLKRLSRPLQLSVLDRIQGAGFESDPDEWIADLLTTAHHSPQGYVLRLGIGKKQVKVLSAEAVEGADLFNAGSVEKPGE